MTARIVSLVPSLTETLFALGLGPQVVGRTHYCLEPADAVSAVPSVGGTKKIRFDRLLALQPTHVVVNVDETPKPLADAIAAAGLELVVTHPLAPRDNLDLFRTLGARFDRCDAAERLCRDFAAVLAHAQAAAKALPRRAVVYLIWRDPWMTVSADTYSAGMLNLVGWRLLGHDPACRYPVIDLSHDLLAQADLVLFATEPYRFCSDDLARFRRDQPAVSIQALLVDGAMVSWYGSRAISAVPYLIALAERAGGPG